MRATKAFDGLGDIGTGFERLEGTRSALALADAARLAGLVFVSSAKYGWSKRELAAWLANDYAGATLAMAGDPASVVGASADALSPTSLTERAVARLVGSARRDVVDMLASQGASLQAPSFVRNLIENGFVVGVSDTTSFGYAAVNRPRMRLVDRVRSLFVADFLSRPRDYQSLMVCATCDEVSFEWDEIHEDDCSMRSPRSGIIVKRHHTTFAGIGEV